MWTPFPKDTRKRDHEKDCTACSCVLVLCFVVCLQLSLIIIRAWLLYPGFDTEEVKLEGVQIEDVEAAMPTHVVVTSHNRSSQAGRIQSWAQLIADAETLLLAEPPEGDEFDDAYVPDEVPLDLCILPGEYSEDENSCDDMAFNNCCLTITDIATPDPYVLSAFGRYYMTFTSGDKVEIWASQNLLDFGRACQRVTVWRPPPNTHYSGGIWAPELHALEGRWYIYVAAEDPKHGNKSHRMYVLGGPPSNYDPITGPWEFLGPIAGMPDHWAIDGTILPLWGKNYFVYSGWPFHNPGESDLIQELFIIELASPTKACSNAVSICQPHEPWERSGNHGINEGPQVLMHPDGQSWLGIAYSCSGSWTKDYKVNTLHYNGGDPLQQSSWEKSRNPLIQGRMRGGAPYGPGHGSFLNVANDTVLVYHATDKPDDGWNNRKARIQRVQWTPQGPWMGEVGPLVDTVQHYMAPPSGVEGGFPGAPHQPQFDPKVEATALFNKAKGFLKKF